MWPSQPSSEWDSWKAWQSQQQDDHYITFDAFTRFFQKQPHTFFPPNPIVNDRDRKYYWYCFGVFTPLVVHQAITMEEIMSLCCSLIAIYDNCKGYIRTLVGDSDGMAKLRHCAVNSNLSALKSIDFEPYCYDIRVVHAHTVCQFSLSSLLLRILAHALRLCGGNTPGINVDDCIYAYENKVFAKNLSGSLTASIWDSTSKPFLHQGRCSKWHSDKQRKCTHCQRLTESLWGAYFLCLDCFKTKCCSICGDSSRVFPSADGFVKCGEHIE